MKKFLLLLILSTALLFSLSGCKNKDEDPEPNNNPPQSNPAVTYTIKWFNENGIEIASTAANEGATPSYSYQVNDTAEWDYTFLGWASSAGGDMLEAIPSATADASYYALVSKTKQKYTVTFNSNGGSAVASQTVEYGSCVVPPEAPTYNDHRFVGWCTDVEGEHPVDFEKAITGNTEYFAIWNEVVNAKALLQALLSGYKLSPISFIPETMCSNYEDNLVEPEDLIENYSDPVNVSKIQYGFGEQWHMVLENLAQSQVFFNALSAIDSIASTSISVFNNYFDKNPSNAAKHSFESGIYAITVDFSAEHISYIVEYTAEIPVLGQQTAQIALSMDVESGEKTVRIQLGDANALIYQIKEDSYEFAIKYLGVRRAMLSIKETESGIQGKIYEYLTVSSVEIGSCADFYITEDYVSVVGNKADGMIGFTGYINELYDAKTGMLLGYEVKEEINNSIFPIVYNTLWFNLKDISGINSIKYLVQKNGDKETVTIYLNGSSTPFVAAKNTLTRKFDIEMRTQYVYSYDSESGTYIEHTIQVPMLFVQEENYETLVQDMKSKNNITVSVKLAGAIVEKILADYDTLIPLFVETKDDLTSDDIVEYIGSKIEF